MGLLALCPRVKTDPKVNKNPARKEEKEKANNKSKRDLT
jgi:hypothetical protein